MDKEKLDDLLARAEAGKTREVEELPQGTPVYGEFLELRIAERRDDGREPSKIMRIKTMDGVRDFWTFGLLNFHLEKEKVEKGDFIYVTKTQQKEKDGARYWNCEFYTESGVAAKNKKND